MFSGFKFGLKRLRRLSKLEAAQIKKGGARPPLEPDGERYSLTVTACSSLKLTADSAGKVMSLLPVNAAPAVPAPAPAAAPMAAPLPPPASPPIKAPRPAPPPITTAERLPLPFSLCSLALVSTGTLWPLMLTEFSTMLSSAPPLKWPIPLESVTVPAASAPEGITVLPSTETGSAMVPVKVSPAFEFLVLSVEPSRTVRIVPAGMVTGCLVIRDISPGFFDVAPEFEAVFIGDDELSVFSELSDLPQPVVATSEAMSSRNNQRRERI